MSTKKQSGHAPHLALRSERQTPAQAEAPLNRSKSVEVGPDPLRARAETYLPMQTNQNRSPDKLPDPWLFNTEQLLRELDRCRELTLQIPITNPNATHFGINVAVTAQWNLREHVRHVALMHGEAQSPGRNYITTYNAPCRKIRSPAQRVWNKNAAFAR